MKPPVAAIRWQPCYRIVSSRFPPIQLFEDVATPEELASIFAIESLTNPRLRQEVGELGMVPPEDRIAGPGTSPIMAAFTHLNREGSRFSDGTFGVYYAGREITTAIRETVHHTERFLGYSEEAAMDVDMRVYCADVAGDLHDIRDDDADPAWYDPESYAASRALGVKLREEGSNGLVYHSVRNPNGQCVAVFRPRLLSPARQGAHLAYRWNGERITHYYEKGRAVQL